LPVEALRYEGGGEVQIPRLLPGGKTMRSLWRRRTRTTLTLLGISVAIAAIVALGAIAQGSVKIFTAMFRGSQTDLLAGVSEMGLSAIEAEMETRIAAHPGVEAVSGLILTTVSTEKMPALIAFGYDSGGFAIGHFRIVEGKPLAEPGQVIVGRQAAKTMDVHVGDTLRLRASDFYVVGLYETGLAYEDFAAVVSLQDAQMLTGKPDQVTWYAIKLHDPEQAQAVRDDLKADLSGVDFSLVSEATENMSDFRAMKDAVGQISFLAIFIGGLGVLNTMLMSVLERTREVGVLRALGWRGRQILGMVLREALTLGVIGGLCGVLLGLGLAWLAAQVPGTLGAIDPSYDSGLFVQAIVVALVTGVVGGLYPAWRATRMRPVEALRYE
jgi:ABC-type lipoprotein release transport system permease subunit